MDRARCAKAADQRQHRGARRLRGSRHRRQPFTEAQANALAPHKPCSERYGPPITQNGRREYRRAGHWHAGPRPAGILPAAAALRTSRKAHLPREVEPARIVVQRAQQRIRNRFGQPGIALAVGTLQPRKRRVDLPTPCMRGGNLKRHGEPAFVDQPALRRVRGWRRPDARRRRRVRARAPGPARSSRLSSPNRSRQAPTRARCVLRAARDRVPVPFAPRSAPAPCLRRPAAIRAPPTYGKRATAPPTRSQTRRRGRAPGGRNPRRARNPPR